jgi:hypothetical protein
MQAQSRPSGTFFLLPGHFSCSTAQAFPRPDRKILTPARAGAVMAGRSAATEGNGLDSAEHDGTMDCSGPGLLLLTYFRLAQIRSALLGTAFSSLSSQARRTMAFEGFGAAMSRTRSPRCRGRNRAVAEARPSRDEGSLCKTANGSCATTIRPRLKAATPSSGTALPSSTYDAE